ncbi:uncharacterized protein LOC129602424 [Paramacrobiotus metropolitanus]|uniref:uncharacterized protein LOC129602424 n=1 Tax=Paramacrobiotus metropolitanus TaxID=2943436 RepID=UPI002445D61E|nr:uncharacterized protein LOC129602424 [Paramacrobiotus metropolitanus]
MPALDEDSLRQESRMSRDAFLRIASLIENHPLFTSATEKPQASPQEQLIVALHRFGTFGNAGSKGMVSRKFGISSGTALLYTRRVICALLSLEKDVVKWPTIAAKREIKHAINEQYDFPHCIGFGDGFHVILENKPAFHGDDYFTRKRRYALNTFAVRSCGVSWNCTTTYMRVGIRTLMTKKLDHTRAVLWTRACIILHNLLLEDYYDPLWNENDDDRDDEEDASAVGINIDMDDTQAGKEKRDFIRNYVLLARSLHN